MRTSIATLASALLLTAFFAAAPGQAKINDVWIGHVTHVSSTNIKVENNSGRVLSFLLVPKFKNIWSDDGKTTYQMAQIKPGMDVKVIYDQNALGARHADKIIVLSHGHTVKSMKS